MSTSKLKKYLKTLSKEDLIKQILELDKKFKVVLEYYEFYLNSDIDAVVKKYKKQIEQEFYPMRGNPKMRLSVARKAIADAKKLGLPPDAMADLMLFYVENGVEFTLDYGDITETFYISMEKMYQSALEFIHKNNLLKLYEKRAHKIMTDSRGIGWGFGDTLADIYCEIYER